MNTMTEQDNTQDMVRDVFPEKIFQDFASDMKEVVKGTSHIENWKLAVGIGSGIIYPTIPFMLGLVYIIYRGLQSNKFELEEGRHYEVVQVKEVEEE